MNVYQKLNAARKKFHSLKLTKSGHNKFAGYYYFELGDFLIPALTVFEEFGLCGTISFACGQNANIAKLCVVNVDKPDEYIPFESPFGSAALKGCHEVQNIGAVETYQRRYLWVAALEIVEHDALDASEPLKEDKPASTSVGASGSDLTAASFSNMQPELQDVLRKMVPRIILAATHKQAEKIRELFVEAQDNLPEEDPTEVKKALWHLLDSKTRSAISAMEKR